MSPSNSLAAIYGIASDCAERKVLGPDVDIEIRAIDETNTRIDVPALIESFRKNDNFGCLALIVVQSNQYPRALDIARPFRGAGIAARSVVSTYRDACRCWTVAPSVSTNAVKWALRSSLAKLKAGWKR